MGDVTCLVNRSVDVGEYLLEPGAPRWDVFRAHYPGCAQCSARLARWSRLEAVLRAATRDRAIHPEGEFLVARRRRPDLLTPDEFRALDSHLNACARCRDALDAALAIFE